MRERLWSRVAELERRVLRLEARVRLTSAELQVQTGGGKAGPARAGRARPRCPGCLLELPRGRKGETCVWCGFVFAAVEPSRRRTGAPKGR